MKDPEPSDPMTTPLMLRRRRNRSVVILAALLALVGLFYAISMARVGQQLANRQEALRAAAP